MTDTTLIESTITRLDKLSGREGLDVSIEPEDDHMVLTFVKDAFDADEDDTLIHLTKSFTTDVIATLVLKNSEENKVSVVIESDEVDDELFNIKFSLPLSRYTVEAVYTYIALAYKNDPFISY